jgi:hypothetical protein
MTSPPSDPRPAAAFTGTSCEPSLCDLDERCRFFANCHHVWRLHAPEWELEAARNRPAQSLDSSQVSP